MNAIKRVLLVGILILLQFGAVAQSAPTITTQPTAQTVVLGRNASFSVTVTGTGPLTFQWRHNGTNIPLRITTVAGNGVHGGAGDGGPATSASLNLPSDVAVDVAGNFFIADYQNNRIRKVDTNGVITTVAGNGIPDFSGDGRPATNAAIDSPTSLAVDGAGTIFFTDLGNNCIRRVGTNGIIATAAGIGADQPEDGSFSGDGGAATNANLNFALGLALDGAGNLFIADSDNNRIRKVDTDGVIRTVAGNGVKGFAGDGGIATNASLNGPQGVGVDGSGSFYVVDTYNNRIRRIGADGIITTVAGNGTSAFSGDGGPATNATLVFANDVAFDAFGNMYIADRDAHRIRKVGTDGIISTAAGNGAGGYSGDGDAATNAALHSPTGIAVDGVGNLFIADRDNYRIRKVRASGPTFTLDNAAATDAGDYDVVVTNAYGSVTSSVAALQLRFPPTIRGQPDDKIWPVGVTGTLSVYATGTPPLSYQWFVDDNAGTPVPENTVQVENPEPFVGDYHIIVSNPYGSVTSRVASITIGYPPAITLQPTNQFTALGWSPSFSIAVSGTGPFSYHWRLNGHPIPLTIVTVAGNGTAGYAGDGGLATNASLNYPDGIALESGGSLLIADYMNNRIRKVDTSGFITTLAGAGTNGFFGDGGAATNAGLSGPLGVSADSLGNLFIADSRANRIRKVDTDGIITTIAGLGDRGNSGDGGLATKARLYQPSDVIPDGTGGVYFTDTGNNSIRHIDPNGVIKTVAGENGWPGRDGDGGAAIDAVLNQPAGLALDGAGNLFIADTINNVIRKIDRLGIIITLSGSGALGYQTDQPSNSAVFAHPNGVAADGLGNVIVADTANNRLRQIYPIGYTTTIAGNGNVFPNAGAYSGDGGDPLTANLNYPSSIVADASGNLFFADSRNNRIREVIAQGPTLEIDGVTTNNLGIYSVVVTSPIGSVVSSWVTLELFPAPDITQQPQNLSVLPGESARFSVTAMDPLPLTYQWYFDNAPLPGQTSNSLQLTNVGFADSGNYQVVLRDQYLAATSRVAVLNIGSPPTLISQPTSQATLPGGNPGFSVTIGGSGPFTYQWRFNGTNLPNIFTVAGGGTPDNLGDGGAATNALLNRPYGVAIDGGGNLFIADCNNNRIREVRTDGTLVTVAGTGAAGYSGDGGAATNAVLNGPIGVALSRQGDLLITDTGNNCIRKIDGAGMITTLAGNGVRGDGGDRGPATNAYLANPDGVTTDAAGDIFIADTLNNRIQEVDSGGFIDTVAGIEVPGYSGDGDVAVNARLFNPSAMTTDNLGNLYLADNRNNVVRQITADGIITAYAGTALAGFSGDGGAAFNATLNGPFGLAMDNAGNLFIGDANNNRIRKIDANGLITTVAGNGSAGYSGDGGMATNASLNNPTDLAVNGFGNLFIADTGNNRIRELIAYGPALVLANAAINQAGNYDVVVTSPFGSVTSSVAALTFLFPPGISQQPQNQTSIVGGNATFSAAATGTAPLSYQWNLVGLPLASQTNVTLILTNVDLAQAGNYTLMVTNLYGSVTSRTALLMVGYPPSIAVQPADQTTVAGQRTEFSVATTGTGPLTYQWQFNGTTIKPTIISVAGNGTAAYSGDGRPATNASLNQPYNLAVDGTGNLFIADYDNNRIRRVDTNGIITTVVGTGAAGYSGDGGPATDAELNGPVGVSVDGLGNLLIADTGNNVIRQVGTSGIITTVAGNGSGAYSGDGGSATNASLLHPYDAMPDPAGGFYIVDSGNSLIRRVDANGIVTLTAGGNGPPGYYGDGGAAILAILDYPSSAAVDPVGNLYIADTGNSVVRAVAIDGTITRTAGGNGPASYSGDDGMATNATLNSPFGVAVNGFGDCFIADSANNRIRGVDAAGIITTIGGNGVSGYSGDGGVATNAELANPSGLTVDASGNVFFADTGNNRIREIIASGPVFSLKNASAASIGDYEVIVTSPFGSVTSSVASLTVFFPPEIAQQPRSRYGAVGGSATFDAAATGTAPLNYQWYFGISALAGQTNNGLLLTNIRPTDAGNYTVVVTNLYGSVTSGAAELKVGFAPGIANQPTSQTVVAGMDAGFAAVASGTGPFAYQWQFNGTNLPAIITTVAGNGSPDFSGDAGPATNAALGRPYGVAMDESGDLFVADYSNNRIRRIDPLGIITTVAGDGIAMFLGDSNPATNAAINGPVGVALDLLGDLLIADTGNGAIREVDLQGIIRTLAGDGATDFYGDGGPATNARLFNPYAVASDSSGNIFIADTSNNRVRKVDTNGTIITIAGDGAVDFYGDGGPATSAALNFPAGIATGADGNLYVADSRNNRIRKIGTGGIITTVAGNGSRTLSGDGGPATGAGLDSPFGVAVDALGNIYFADSELNRIRKIDFNGIITTVAGNGTTDYSGDGAAAVDASLAGPSGVAVDGFGNVVFADTGNSRVREIIAPGPALNLNHAGARNAGTYDLVVTSLYGSVTSGVVSLTVLLPPAISRQPQGGAVIIGGDAALDGSAIGTDPLGYQWLFNGAVLSGQTNTGLKISNVGPADAGGYTLIVTNLYGSTTSRVATLAVGLAPVITVQPGNQMALAGGGAEFGLAVSGAGPITYQWRFNGTNLPAIITTVAGTGVPGFSGDGGPATSAQLDYPFGLALDRSNNLFIADYINHRVRRVDAGGTITTVAGNGSQGYSGDGGMATNAGLGGPISVAVDDSGNLLIADADGDRIRKVNSDGVITAIAGIDAAGYSGDGGPATDATLFNPIGVTVDGSGGLFIVDGDNSVIRQVGADGIINTVAGDGIQGFSGDGGLATNAMLDQPYSVTVDNHGNLLIVESGDNRVRLVDADDVIATIAGGGTNGFSGDGGRAVDASLNNPFGVAVDSAGNRFITDSSNNRIRKVDTNGTITTVAGTGAPGYSGDNAEAPVARLNNPTAVILDGSGNMLFADTLNYCIRKIRLSAPTLALNNVGATNTGNYDVVVTGPFGSVTSTVVSLTVLLPPTITQVPQSQSVAVGGNATFDTVATGTAPLNYQWYFGASVLEGQTNSNLALTGVGLTNAGDYSVVVTNLYGSATSSAASLLVGFAPAIAIQPSNQMTFAGGSPNFSVTATGTSPLTYQWQFNGVNLPVGIFTVAGNGNQGYSGDGGPATNATLNHPYGLALDAAGNLVIADYQNNRIRRVAADGTISTVAGTGNQSYSGNGGPATNAGLSGPVGVAFDRTGNLFIADTGNNVVRVVGLDGLISNFAGVASPGYSGDGGPAINAALSNPFSVAPDNLGNVFIADSLNQRVRRVDPKGVITTIAGTGTAGSTADGGIATAAQLNNPFGVASDGLGNLYIADNGNSLIREVDTNNVIHSIAGSGGPRGYTGDGVPATSAAINGPFSVAADDLGNFFVADSGNNRIRKIDGSGIITTLAGTGLRGFAGDGGAATNAALNNPSGIIVAASGNLFIADTDNCRVRKVIVPGPALLVQHAGGNNAGNYDVVITSPFGSVTSSIVTLKVVLPPLRASISAGNALYLQLAGTAGQTYILQAATNLVTPVNWQPVYTNAADASGNWSFTNSNLPGNPATFYRVTVP